MDVYIIYTRTVCIHMQMKQQSWQKGIIKKKRRTRERKENIKKRGTNELISSGRLKIKKKKGGYSQLSSSPHPLHRVDEISLYRPETPSRVCRC